MEQILKILQENALTSPESIGKMLNLGPDQVRESIQALRESGQILAYKAVIDEALLTEEKVKAIIEVRITPERGGGFNHLAERISRFDEVSSCYLMSGGYDLLVMVEGRSLKEVAAFVSEKLATLGGVLSTATHFHLKSYKEQGVLMLKAENEERLPVSP
ncbi:MAG: Lrp/AsnC family transcriptional regulator [Verrucomicrobiae bacterium]|nr:Lrp/AsnC family transcriptional regulator [Verrucomicrobiae bacterium]